MNLPYSHQPPQSKFLNVPRQLRHQFGVPSITYFNIHINKKTNKSINL